MEIDFPFCDESCIKLVNFIYFVKQFFLFSLVGFVTGMRWMFVILPYHKTDYFIFFKKKGNFLDKINNTIE